MAAYRTVVGAETPAVGCSPVEGLLGSVPAGATGRSGCDVPVLRTTG